MQSPTIKINAGSSAGNGLKGKDYVQLSDGSLVVFIAAFKAPSNISSFIVSAPSLSGGYKGVSVSGDAKCGGVWATDSISGGTEVSLTNYTGGNGGPGGPGGGFGGW